MSQPPRSPHFHMHLNSSQGGACSAVMMMVMVLLSWACGCCSEWWQHIPVPGRSGPTLARKMASPPTEMQSSEAPWKDSHMEMVLWRPVAMRASLRAIPTAVGASVSVAVSRACAWQDSYNLPEVPPGQKRTRLRSPGASAASLVASSTATSLV